MTVIRPGGGELIGDSPDRRIELLCDHDALAATWTRFGPRREGADLHVHRHHSDLFYVLEGELTTRLGPEGEGVVLAAGTLVRVPPLVVHGYRNASDAEVRFLNFHAPGQDFATYMRALRDGRPPVFDQEPPPPDGGRPATEAVISTAEILAATEAIRIVRACGGPGNPVPPRAHERHLESFYVLEGELVFTIGDREVRAPAGSWAQIPAGLPHAVSFPEPARYLNVRAPTGG